MQITRTQNKFCKDFEMKNLGEYHDLYVQSDTLLLADVFSNFCNVCLELCGLDLAHFLSAPGLAWKAAIKNTKLKLDILTSIDMVENDTQGRTCYAIHRYTRVNNKYMKDYDKNKESSYLTYWDVNNVTKVTRVGNFKWVEETSQFNEGFIKSYNKDIL